LDIKESKFSFILDLLSGNPYKLFQSKIQAGNIMDLKLEDIKASKFDYKRLSEVSRIIGLPTKQTKEI
jgi:hypothetical protein